MITQNSFRFSFTDSCHKICVETAEFTSLKTGNLRRSPSGQVPNTVLTDVMSDHDIEIKVTEYNK